MPFKYYVDTFAKITKKIHINHLMRRIIIHMDENHYVTYAYDGLVIIRSTDWTHQYATVMSHHRRYGGVIKAYSTPLREYVVALGRDNTLVCLALTNLFVNENKRSELINLVNTPSYQAMFTNTTDGFIPPDVFKDNTWLEVEEIKRVDRERSICEKEKKAIVIALKKIRKEVKILLKQNIEGPENEKLDIQDFNLDEDMKTKAIYNNENECDRTKLHNLNIIEAQDKVTKWIKSFCWDKMSEQGKAIFAIFGYFDVQNYVIMPNDGEQEELLKCMEEQRTLEVLLSCEDNFEPWIPAKRSDIRERLEQNPKMALAVPTPATSLFLSAAEIQEEEEDIEIGIDTKEEIDMETITAFAGSLTHTFVTVEKIHYPQQQIQSFSQMNLQKLLSQKENYKLKTYFNKEFENLMSQKIREINNVIERNARLRHILSEFNHFSPEKLDILVTDPEWKQEENPELIIKVEDKEVGVLPYISPSEQALLDAEAAEKERLRLLMLADDFRERALYAMMWGVLEIRWEDELRKDVPKPKCMIEKDPENYNEEDLKAIKDYEEKVKFLNSERERYKKILTTEYIKLGNILREGVKKFNGRLSDLFLQKIKIDTAIGQENLKISRLVLNNYKRILMNTMEKEVELTIKKNEKEIEQLAKTVASLHENLNEIHARTEVLQAREKALERSFKKEFGDASPVAVEQIQKINKKRPKVNIRSITSITLLMELAKCLTTHERSIILTSECLEFLKAMDTLDVFPGLINAVDEHMYKQVCKHRRYKIESEIKIKASLLETTEAENTVAMFNKMLANKKEYHSILISNLAQIRIDRIKDSLNIELQLVLKQGYVEVPTTGFINDFKDAIMVSKNDVAEINKMIAKVGNRKLKVMRETMNFRRGILAMEWEHNRMKMKIADLKSHLKDIDLVKVTKEIQAYLKMKAKGLAPKELTFEQEIDLIKKSYERIIEERKDYVQEINEKIKVIKKDTKKFNRKISEINVDVCEFKLEVDEALEQREKDLIRIRMATLLKRAKLVKQIQENHNEILVLQTELELLRLKTYPTLKFKIVS